MASRDARRDNASSRRPPESASRRLVQVFKETALPTDPNKYFATHPVSAGGAEQEGSTPSFVVDATTTLYAIFLGGVPAIGENYVATSVGGRWVAEKHGSKSPCGCWTCNGTVPMTDLTLKMVGTNICDNSTFTYSIALNFYGANQLGIGNFWYSDLFSGDFWTQFSPAVFKAFLGCSDTGPVLGIVACNTLITNPCAGGPGLSGWDSAALGIKPDCITAWSLTSQSQSPFSATWAVTKLPDQVTTCLQFAGGCVPVGDNPAVPTVHFNTLTVTGPDNPPAESGYCVRVCPSWCGGPVPGGSTVTFKDPNTGETIATGTTGSSGCVTLDVGSKGPWTLTVEAENFTTFTVTQSFGCSYGVTLCLAYETLTLSYTTDGGVFDNPGCDTANPGASQSGTITLTKDHDSPNCRWIGVLPGVPETDIYAMTCDWTDGAGATVYLQCFSGTWQLGFAPVGTSIAATSASLDPFDIEFGPALSYSGLCIFCRFAGFTVTA